MMTLQDRRAKDSTLLSVYALSMAIGVVCVPHRWFTDAAAYTFNYRATQALPGRTHDCAGEYTRVMPSMYRMESSRAPSE